MEDNQILPPPDEVISLQVSRSFMIERALTYLRLPHIDTKESPSYITMLNELKFFGVETLHDLQINFAITELDVQIQNRLAQNNRVYYVERISEILSDLCGLCVDAPHDLVDLSMTKKILSTGDPLLDDLFDGGFRCGSLIEICGESGCGKTQICLQLLVQCVCPSIMGGLGSRSCYITTENYPRSRLIELIQHRLNTLHSYIGKVEGVTFPELSSVEKFLDKILVRDRVIYTVEEFDQVIYNLLQSTVENNPIRLLVIDSIAALYRTPRDGNDINYQNRASELWKLSSHLKKLAFEHGICIVLVNHVADRMSNFRTHPKCRLSGGREVEIDESTFLGSQRDKKPALGLFWSSMVNMRIMLSRKKNCKVFVRNEVRATKKKLLNDKNVIYVYKESLKNSPFEDSSTQDSNGMRRRRRRRKKKKKLKRSRVNKFSNEVSFIGDEVGDEDEDDEDEDEDDDEESEEEEEEEEETEGERGKDDGNDINGPKKSDSSMAQGGQYYPHREIKVIFSPYLKEEVSLHFVVENVGVRGIKVYEGVSTSFF